MLTFWGNRHRFCDGLSRRQFLQVGTLGLAGLSLVDLLRLRAEGAAQATPKSVIMIWLDGGPPPMDMYDLKPDAPETYRGEFKPIRTKVPGFDICELMPLQAQMADKFAVVRSLTFPPPSSHDCNLCFSGFHGVLQDDQRRPAFGSLVSRFRSATGDRLPHYVSMVESNPNGQGLAEPPHYVGAAHKPFRIAKGEAQKLNLRPVPGVTIAQLEDRRKLLAGLDTLRRDLDTGGTFAGMDAFSTRAMDMITSPKALEAFDITREPDKVRERYGVVRGKAIVDGGQFKWQGEGLLLARRLVEAGVSVVTVQLPYWDLHGGHRGNIFNSLRIILPLWDQALCALLTDLQERGLEKDVAVVAWGEMGRTPNIIEGGRDHWSDSACALFAGGGLKVGQVVGATDSRCVRPRTRAYGPQNVLATLYDVLGIDPSATVPDYTGRPMNVLDDPQPIAELL
jgi:hypothetical protein